MPVYIDQQKTTPNEKGKFITSCMMVADTRVELMEMARNLRLNEFASEKYKGVECFRLTASQREEAANHKARLCVREWFDKKFKELQEAYKSKNR